MMDNKTKSDICKYEMLKAQSSLTEAIILFEAEQYPGAANRSYYAVFHAMTATLILDDIAMSKHAGVISKFREQYIKTHVFENEMSDWITALFQLRTECDYDCFYVVSKQDVKEKLNNAAKMIEKLKEYTDSRLKSNAENQ